MSAEEIDKVVEDVFRHDQGENEAEFEARLFKDGVSSLRSFLHVHADYGGSTYNALTVDLHKLERATKGGRRDLVLELQQRISPMVHHVVRGLAERRKAEAAPRHPIADRLRHKDPAKTVRAKLKNQLNEDFPIGSTVPAGQSTMDWYQSTVNALKNRISALAKYRGHPGQGYERAVDSLERTYRSALAEAREQRDNEKRSLVIGVGRPEQSQTKKQRQEQSLQDRAPTQAPVSAPVPTAVPKKQWLPENETAFSKEGERWIQRFKAKIAELTATREAKKKEIRSEYKALVQAKKNKEALALLKPVKDMKEKIKNYTEALGLFDRYVQGGRIEPSQALERYAEKPELKAIGLQPPLRRPKAVYVAPAARPRSKPKASPVAGGDVPPSVHVPLPKPPSPRAFRGVSGSSVEQDRARALLQMVASSKPRPKPAQVEVQVDEDEKQGEVPDTGAAGTSSVAPVPRISLAGIAADRDVALLDAQRKSYRGETAFEYMSQIYARGYKDDAALNSKINRALAGRGGGVSLAAMVHKDATKGQHMARPVAHAPKPKVRVHRDYTTNKDRDEFFNSFPYEEQSTLVEQHGAKYYRNAPRVPGRPSGFRLVGPHNRQVAMAVPVHFDQTPDERDGKRQKQVADSHHHLDDILKTYIERGNHPARFHPVPPFDVQPHEKHTGKVQVVKYIDPKAHVLDMYNPHKPFTGHALDHRASFDNVEQALRGWGFDPDAPMGDLEKLHPNAFRLLTRQTLSLDNLHIGKNGKWVAKSSKNHGVHPLMGTEYFMPQNRRQKKDNPGGPKIFKPAKVPNAYLTRDDGAQVWDQAHMDAWRSVPQKFFRPWLPWAVDHQVKATHTDFKTRPTRAKIDKLRKDTIEKYGLKAGDKHAYYEEPKKGPTADANLSWILARGGGARKTNASFKIQKGKGSTTRSLAGSANWQWLGAERPDDGALTSVLSDVDGKAGRPLQQYFEGFQATLFGSVLTPYQDMMRYYGPNNVKLSPEEKAPILAALDKAGYATEEQRNALGQLLEKLPVDPGEDHNNVFATKVRDVRERQKYFNKSEFIDLMDKAFPDHEDWRDHSLSLREKRNPKVWKVARKVMADRMWNLRSADGTRLTREDLYAILKGRGQRKRVKTAAAVVQVQQNQANVAADAPAPPAPPAPMPALEVDPSLPPAVVVVPVLPPMQTGLPDGSAPKQPTPPPPDLAPPPPPDLAPPPDLTQAAEQWSIDHAPPVMVSDQILSKPAAMPGPLAGYHKPGAPLEPVITFFKLKKGEQARDIQALIRQHHGSHRAPNGADFGDWFKGKLKTFRKKLADQGHFPHAPLTEFGTSRFLSLAAQHDLDRQNGVQKVHAPIGKYNYGQTDVSGWGPKETMHEGMMLELADLQRRLGSTPQAPLHAWENTHARVSRAEKLAAKSGLTGLIRSLKENLDVPQFGRGIMNQIIQRSGAFEPDFTARVKKLFHDGQDEEAVDMVVAREKHHAGLKLSADQRAADIEKARVRRFKDFLSQVRTLEHNSQYPRVQANEKLARETAAFIAEAKAYHGQMHAYRGAPLGMDKLETKLGVFQNRVEVAITPSHHVPAAPQAGEFLAPVARPVAPAAVAEMHQVPERHMGLQDPYQRRTRVTARPVGRGEMGYRVRRHLGRHAGVALVHMGGLHEDQHFMKDIEGDVNMGRRAVMNKRRGPFRKEEGRSRVMARTANTVIRKRRSQLEITVAKSVQSHELDVLFGKLRSHALAVSGTIVYLVSGRSRKNLGTLDMLDLDAVRRELLQLLTRSKQVGLLLIDVTGAGGMHHHHLHRARFARSFARENNSYSY